MTHSSHRYENFYCSQIYLKQYFIVTTFTSTNIRLTHQHLAGPYHQHKTIYCRTPNLPCYCNNTSTKVFLICSSEFIFFWSMDLWNFTFQKLLQCVNICHIFQGHTKQSLKDLAQKFVILLNVCAKTKYAQNQKEEMRNRPVMINFQKSLKQ